MNEEWMLEVKTFLLKEAMNAVKNENPTMVSAIAGLYHELNK
ncbi:hypothetical protein [Lentilactobacillus parabuchneri]|jgi:hypothetical protein|nr:hypothetical protein [Lentilactobacillus parabuchneri]